MKGRDTPEAKRIAGALADLLVQEATLDFALMSSFDHDALAVARARVPELDLAPERLPEHGPPDAAAALRQAQALGARILQHYYTQLTPAVMQTLHDHDIAVWAWPTDTEQSLVDSVALGADGVIGDDYQMISAVLDRLCPTSAAGADGA